MSTITQNTLTSKIFLSVFIALFFISLNSSAKKIWFTTSSVVPAARGYVKISRDNNKNYMIKIEIINLAEADRLQPTNSNYVVWMVSDGASAMNMGQIKSSDSFLSSKLKASFETASPFKPTQIFITAEEDPSYQYPGTQTVLTTKKF